MPEVSLPTAAELVALAFHAENRGDFRAEVMRRLMASLGADWAIFAEADECLPASGLVNLDVRAANDARHTVLSSPRELRRGNEQLRQRGAFVDSVIYSRKEWERLPHIALHQAAWGMTSNLVMSWLNREGSPVIVNLARSHGYYSEHQQDWACGLVKALAVADGWPGRPPPLDLDAALSDRQREILHHVALGLTNPQIARACGISLFTVRNHLVRLFERFGVSTRTELAMRSSPPRPGRK